MIRTVKGIIFLNLLFTSFITFSQTTNSPYSQFGLGDLEANLLPQSKSMGGISMGIRKLGDYNIVNLANPASYSSIRLTTFDIGTTTNLRWLDQDNVSENNFDVGFSHLVFGIPVHKKSALSFGLVPYSKVGYRYRNASTIFNSVDNVTTSVDYLHVGEGGVSKVYLGYGILVTPNLSIGANFSYLFGKLQYSKSIEFPQDGKALNSREQTSSKVRGMNIDYGVQYSINMRSKSKLIIGYAGTLASRLNSVDNKEMVYYRNSSLSDNESVSLGSSYPSSDGTEVDWNLPMKHTLGFTYGKTSKFLIGADASYSQWSTFRQGTKDPGLNNSYGISLGGQFTPDVNATSSYFKLIDYRLGFKYDKTHIKINNHDIDQYALTFGLGLPLSSLSNICKVNFSTEIGRKGMLDNGLVRENYINFSLGFMMNDKWFRKYKLD